MSRRHTAPSLVRRLSLGLFALAVAAASTAAQADPACTGAEACVRDIMLAARAGKDIEQYRAISRLQSIAGLPPGREGSYRATAEKTRQRAFSLLQAGKPQEAEQVLRTALTTLPTIADFWNHLAIALQIQGKADDAVSALVAAHFWSPDPAETARGYERLANDAGFGGAHYRTALDAIAANAAAMASLDAALPPPGYARVVAGGEPPTKLILEPGSCGPFAYPVLALEANQQGTVVLHFYVDASGQLTRVRKSRSSGHAVLDDAVAANLTRCRFRPAMQDGQPVGGWEKITYSWTLD